MANSDYVRDHKGNRTVPRWAAQAGAGKDAYLRLLCAPCHECGKLYVLGESDSPALCQACFDEAGEENARLDAKGV